MAWAQPRPRSSRVYLLTSSLLCYVSRAALRCWASRRQTGAVGCMQARDGESGCIADVVQPGGGFHKVGVSAEDGCQAACSPDGALDVRPARGGVSWRGARARCSAYEPARRYGQVDSLGGRLTNVACRLKATGQHPSASSTGRPSSSGGPNEHVGAMACRSATAPPVAGDLAPRHGRGHLRRRCGCARVVQRSTA